MKISLFSKKRSDGESFEELIMPYVEGLYRLAYHYTQHQSDAEDLVQDLLLKLYKRTDELRSIENLKPWLAKSLYHLYIDKIRQSQRQPVVKAEELDDLSHSEALVSGLPPTHQQDLQRDLNRALAQISPDHRQVIVLHDIESYTLEEICEVLDTPIGTLKSRLHRGRAHLRKILEDGTF